MSALALTPRRLSRLLVLASMLALTGCWPDDSPRISIDFGMYPDELEGREVLIDGQVVGTLDRLGQATRMSWPVEPGRHEVQISHPSLQCEPVRVTAELRGQKVRLMADIQEAYRQDGSFEPVITLQY